MQYYAGLDVGLKSTCICVVDSNGKEVHTCEVASDAEVIHRKLASLKLDYQRVGLETGQLSIHLTKTLRKLDLPAVCMDARQVAAALSTVINKTDRNDARGIAHLLRCGLFREVHVKSDDACNTRILLASRLGMEALVASLEQLRSACKLLDGEVKKHASQDARSRLLMRLFIKNIRKFLCLYQLPQHIDATAGNTVHSGRGKVIGFWRTTGNAW